MAELNSISIDGNSYNVDLPEISSNLQALLLDEIYPVGSIYTTISSADYSHFLGGVWTKVGTGRTLMGASSDSQLGTTVNSGLPDFSFAFITRATQYNGGEIVFNSSNMYHDRVGYGGDILTQSNNPSGNNNNYHRYTYTASAHNSIYGGSNIVQPPAVYVYFWQRTA